MPKALLDFLGYTFYFYSNESGEPVHIHVSKGKPTDNSTKFWIKRDSIVMEHNKGNIPNREDAMVLEMYPYSQEGELKTLSHRIISVTL